MKNVIIVLALLIGGCFIIEQCNKSERESRSDVPVYGEPTTPSAESETDDSYNSNSSSSDESEIVSCPKCGVSYNKATWGAMCNSCWSDGRGLKSNGHDILE